MRIFFLSICFSLIIPVLPCSVALASDGMIPSSNKSQDAYRRVAPRLMAEMKKKGLSLGDPVFIRLFKTEQQLEVWLRKGLSYILFKSYTICYQSGKIGPKIREGDKQSPEGFYTVTAKQLNPNSDYHLSFNLGFPNEYDRSLRRTGSLLMVHGRCSSVGCFAMTDYRMDEIYAIVESAIISGQQQVPVHIFPFKMTQKNMMAHGESKWITFWENLKEGYDYFEGYHLPPLVTVQSKRYQFTSFKTLFFGGTLPPSSPLAKRHTAKRVSTSLKGSKQRQFTAQNNEVTPSPSPLAPLYLGD
jgi:murein L,D-transpeptidase YafK